MAPSLRLFTLCAAASQALKPEFLKAPAASQGLNRREILKAPAALALANLALPAVAADTKTISVPVGSSAKDGSPLSKATFSVPSDWVKLSGDPGGGRKMELYADPNNADTNAFALITPVRGDYTSLGSFGSSDGEAAAGAVSGTAPSTASAAAAASTAPANSKVLSCASGSHMPSSSVAIRAASVPISHESSARASASAKRGPTRVTY